MKTPSSVLAPSSPSCPTCARPSSRQPDGLARRPELFPKQRGYRLFEVCADLVDAGFGASFVVIDAGPARDADAANNLIANLDAKTTDNERDARQLAQAPGIG